MDTVKFMCKRSGNIVAFHTEYDILSMKREPGYEIVTQCDDTLRAEEPKIVAHEPAKRGRKRKAQI